MVISQIVPVKTHNKYWHVHKVGGRLHNDFAEGYGDIPIGRINEITKKFEPCVNTRGLAYAKRNDMKYRKNKHEDWRSEYESEI